MKNRHVKSFLIPLLTVLFLSACGGGGGGGSPAVVNTPPADPDAFSLKPVKSLAAGTMSFAMTGTDSNSIQYTASLTITNTPNWGIVDGKLLNRVQSQVTITNTTVQPAVSTSANGSSYYTSDYTLIFIVDNDQEVTCSPVANTYQAPPDNVKVNDQGNLVSLTCTDKDRNPINTTISITWRLDAGATADQAKFVVTQTSYVAGILNSTEEDRYIIDKAGNVKGIEVVVTKGGVIRTLSGNRL